MTVVPLLRLVIPPPLEETLADLLCLGSSADVDDARALFAADAGPEKTQAADILICMADLLARGYTTGADARDVNGARCAATSPEARYFSVVGALFAVASALGSELYPNAPLIVCFALAAAVRPAWRDLESAEKHATQREALGLVDRAKRRLAA